MMAPARGLNTPREVAGGVGCGLVKPKLISTYYRHQLSCHHHSIPCRRRIGLAIKLLLFLNHFGHLQMPPSPSCSFERLETGLDTLCFQVTL